MEGVSFKLVSITRTVSKPSADGKGTVKERVTYVPGDPEFDTYEKEMKALAAPKEIGLPKNFLGPDALCSTGNVFHLDDDIANVFERYYQGTSSTDEIEKTLSRVVADIRSTYAGLGFDPEEFTGKLIEDVYSETRLFNMRGVGIASSYEGRPIAVAHNGHDRNTRNWAYYNADYYYASEEMKGTLQGIARKIGAKYGVTDLNLPIEYQDGDVRKGIYSSYNTQFSRRIRNDCRIGSIIDESMAPPKGLKFFYMDAVGTDPYVHRLPNPENDPYATFDGFLSVSYGDWSFTGRVPIRMDATQFPISVNMFDMVNKRTGGRFPQEIRSFLQNVDFFSMVQSGPYMASHPRKF